MTESPDHDALVRAEAQLGEYFAGGRTTFDLQLDFIGSEFQNKVWQALLSIPYGATCTYSEIAMMHRNR